MNEKDWRVDRMSKLANVRFVVVLKSGASIQCSWTAVKTENAKNVIDNLMSGKVGLCRIDNGILKGEDIVAIVNVMAEDIPDAEPEKEVVDETTDNHIVGFDSEGAAEAGEAEYSEKVIKLPAKE
jgi:hypothetical protein